MGSPSHACWTVWPAGEYAARAGRCGDDGHQGSCGNFGALTTSPCMQEHHPIAATIPHRRIRATYDETTIRVYQAYSDEIAEAALAKGTFASPPFKMERMTWIKPSFLWMMYRAGWGWKDAGQARILAIDISREGFEWALAHSCPSHPEDSMSSEEWQRMKASSPVRIRLGPRARLAAATSGASCHSDWPEQGGG